MSQRIGHIPGLDPDSMETVLPDNAHPLEWCMNDKGEILQGPLEMTYLDGKKIVLNLAPDQVGLLTATGKLRTIYLDGGHILDVGTSPGQIHPDWQLVFLAADRPLNLRWTFGNPIALPGPEKRHIIGICDLAITGPADFYDHFLQSLPDLDARALLDAVERATRQALIDYLDLACCQGMGGQACLQTTLMNLQPDTLSEGLTRCGVACTHLSLYTAQPPVEDGPGIQTGEDTAGHSSHLAHN